VQWWLYSAGSLGWAMINFALSTMFMFRYAPAQPNANHWPILTTTVLAGLAMFSGRIFDAISDPLVGHYSDRVRTRWGRRRPFMAAGLPPLILSFILVFTPPTAQQSAWNAAYLAAALSVYVVAFTLYVGPYLALLPEISTTPAERVHLATLLGVFSLVGTALGGVGAPWLTQRFDFLGMAVVIGAVGMLFMLLPFLVQERADLPPPTGLPFLASLRSVWDNPPFRPYLVGQVLLMMTLNAILSTANYFAVCILGKETAFGSVVIGVAIGAAAAGMAPVNWLALRWGKRRAFQLCMLWLSAGLFGVGAASFLLVGQVLPWLAALGLTGLALSGVFVLPNAMLADVVDADAERTGTRREAVHYGIQALGTKMSAGLSAIVVGLVLTLGHTAQEALGVQLVLPVAGMFPLLAAWAFQRYPIDS